MAVHWVNYDLNKTGQNYDGLITYLESFGTWARPVRSSFLVKTTLTAAQLANGIKSHVDGNDVVMVMTVTGADWATQGVPTEVVTWLRNNL
ncbi:hypothetical protein MAFF212519_27820 [Clavibacter michiganensis]